MNLEIAVDPGTVKASDAFSVLATHLGFYQGRLISRFPGDWIPRAYNEAADLPDLERHRIVAALQRIKESALIPSARLFDTKKSWLENAEIQHRERAFAEVYCREKSEFGTAITEVFGRYDWSDLSGEKEVGSEENLLRSFKPLLSSSGTIYLMDPYFAPKRKANRSLFNAILNSAFSSRCIEFKAFVREKDSGFPKDRCGPYLRSLIDGDWKQNRRVTIVAFEDATYEAEQHARYLFSERGGFRLDKGLQVSESKVDVSLVNKTTHDELMKTLVERTFPFKVVFECSIAV